MVMLGQQSMRKVQMKDFWKVQRVLVTRHLTMCWVKHLETC